MYAQEECFTQHNYLKLTNMDKIDCLIQNSCMMWNTQILETLDETNPEIRTAETFVAIDVVKENILTCIQYES